MQALSIERVVPSGAIRVSDFVTDGSQTWLHSEIYFGFTKREAGRLFMATVAENGWTIAP